MRGNQWRLASALVVCGLVASFGELSQAFAVAGECLSGPKGETPQGKHWYYRIERPSKRHCWYLGDEGKRTTAKTATTEQPEQSSPEKPSPKRNSEQLEPAVANARAEVTKDVSVPFTTMPPLGQQMSPPPSETLPQPNHWSLADRWIEPQSPTRTAQAETTDTSQQRIASAAPPAPVRPQPAAIQKPIPQQAATTAPPATTADDEPDMFRMALGILTAAIALAAIFGRLIASHIKPRPRPVQRRAIWQSVDEAELPPVYARGRAHDPSLRARAEQDIEDLLRALRYPEAARVTSPAVSANRGRRPRDPSGARA